MIAKGALGIAFGYLERIRGFTWDFSSADLDDSPNLKAGGAFEIRVYGFQTVFRGARGFLQGPGHLWEGLGRTC